MVKGCEHGHGTQTVSKTGKNWQPEQQREKQAQKLNYKSTNIFIKST